MKFRELTRKNQSLSQDEIIELLKQEKRGVLSVLGDHGYPYGIPMNYYYDEDNGHIYFHSGQQGHKIDAIRNHNQVSFCIYDQGYRNEGEWALNIKSVICFGRIYEVTGEQALHRYRQLSLKFTHDLDYIESEITKLAEITICYELRIEHISGKLVNEA